jgi:uncharacterized protein (DUF111 family)
MLAYTTARLLELGAADAWLVPVIGTKNRPADLVCVLCSPGMADRFEAVLVAEAGSLAARRVEVRRRALPRSAGIPDVDGHAVRFKRGPHRRATKAECEDLAALARAADRRLREILDRRHRN